MSDKHIWMVRAGDYNELVEDFWNKAMVAIGWFETGDWSGLKTREDFKDRFRKIYADRSEQSVIVNASQCYRFVHEMNLGDYVLSYDKSSREYLAGEVTSQWRYDKNAISDSYPNVRNVKWHTKIARDSFSPTLKNVLGGALTIFRFDKHMKEIEGLIKGESVPTEIIEEEEEAAATPFYDDVKEKADELISDAISSINPYDFQDLVAALLRSMGFRTTVSPPGPDRGVDIIAHPDAFGFQNPRIKVQVKHRTSPASGPDLRNFMATLRDGESGLFVSTGGFTRDGLSEPERSTRPVTLIDRDAFVDLLIENYENLEPEYKALIPLKKVFIPAKM